MKSHALRAEFIITGAALLLALVGLLDVYHWAKEIHWLHPETILSHKTDTGPALLLAAILTGAAYVLGVVCVYVAYEIPAKWMINRVRNARFDDLVLLDEHLRRSVGNEEVPPTSAVYAAAFRTDPKAQHDSKKVERHARTVVLSLSRCAATSELAAEFNYRRSNRQVLTGLFPSMLVGAWDGIAVSAKHHHAQGIWLTVIGLCVLAVLTYRAALYQERVSQSLLLDTAFGRMWNTDGQATGSDPASQDKGAETESN